MPEAQSQGIRQYVETDLTLAPELLGVTPWLQAVTDSQLVYGSFVALGGPSATTFVQRLDGTGYAEVDDFIFEEGNDSGFIVGSTSASDPARRTARFFDPTAGVVDIVTPGFSASRLLDISDDGVAVGWAANPSPGNIASRPIVYDTTGFRELELPEEAETGRAFAISPGGRLIVGEMVPKDGTPRRLVYWQDGVVFDSGIDTSAVAGMSINDEGLVDVRFRPFVEPFRSLFYNVFTGEGGFGEFSPEIPAGVGIASDGLILVNDAYGGTIAGPNLFGFIFDGTLVGAEAAIDGDLSQLLAVDISREGNLILTRDLSGGNRVFRAIPSPSVPAVFGGAALLANRRRR